LAAKKATTSIPIVFYSSADPVGTGLVASLPRPGGNITGSSASSADIAAKNLELLAEIVGRRQLRVTQIQPRGTRSAHWFPVMETAIAVAASRLGARYEYVELDAISEIDPLLIRLARGGVDAVTIESFALGEQQSNRIAAQLIELRLVSFGNPWAGQLFTYEPDWLQLARIAAQNVDKILKGTAPAQVPVQQPSLFDLTINLKTAKALGLTIPDSVLLRANEVIR
jgi:putative ABC transport system substrate-binding protein